MREFDTGATRDDDDSKLDYEGFLSPIALQRYAQYMHKHRTQANGELRASDNWQKGIPTEEYRKSLVRHILDFWILERTRDFCGDMADEREDLLCAILFNTFGMLHEFTKDK